MAKRKMPQRGWLRREGALSLAYNPGVQESQTELLILGEDFAGSELTTAQVDAHGATQWYIERLIVEGFCQTTVWGTSKREWAKDVCLFLASMDLVEFNSSADYDTMTYFEDNFQEYFERILGCQLLCSYPRHGMPFRDAAPSIPVITTQAADKYIPAYGDSGYFRFDLSPNMKLFRDKCIVLGVSIFGALGAEGWESTDAVRVNYGLTALVRKRKL